MECTAKKDHNRVAIVIKTAAKAVFRNSKLECTACTFLVHCLYCKTENSQLEGLY